MFLDRDGVLNEVPGSGRRPRSPRSLDELAIVVNATAAVERLRTAGFTLIAITNQPDVARGHVSREVALEVTQAVVARLGLDDAYVCLHDESDGCECRKPRPGALLAAASDWGIELERSWMIGDRWVDVAAGNAAGARTVLIERPYSWEPAGGVECTPDVRPVATVASVLDAAEWVVRFSAPELS